MSLLAGKCVLVVGDNPFLVDLVKRLTSINAEVRTGSYSELDKNLLSNTKTDLIIINYANEYTKHLDTLHNDKDLRKIPVLALVEDNEENIEKVLYHGAVDYFISENTTEEVVQKITEIMHQSGVLHGESIDITPIRNELKTPGLRVYVIEDDPLLRNLLFTKLQKSSFICEFSSDGLLPTETLQKFAPDIIILDLMLPGKSGFDVLKDIKATEKLKTVPVIVFSNRDSQEDRNRAKELGASSFHIKAMTDLSELVNIIQDSVQK